jgi:hypothetical protein
MTGNGPSARVHPAFLARYARAEAADRDGMSLNTFANVACARAVGAQTAAEPHGQVAEAQAHRPAALAQRAVR